MTLVNKYPKLKYLPAVKPSYPWIRRPSFNDAKHFYVITNSQYFGVSVFLVNQILENQFRIYCQYLD